MQTRRFAPRAARPMFMGNSHDSMTQTGAKKFPPAKNFLTGGNAPAKSEPVFIAAGRRMGEDLSRQTRNSFAPAAILTDCKGNRRGMVGKRPAGRRGAAVNKGSQSPSSSWKASRTKASTSSSVSKQAIATWLPMVPARASGIRVKRRAWLPQRSSSWGMVRT